MNRRSWLQKSVAVAVTSALVTTSSTMTIQPAYADEADDFFNDPAVQENYNNPNIPQAPEEKSGLVVLVSYLIVHCALAFTLDGFYLP